MNLQKNVILSHYYVFDNLIITLEKLKLPVADAVSDEHAVVLPLEDADAADGAVPRPRRLHRLAHRAELPLLPDRRRQDHVARRRVGQPQPDEVPHDVHQELSTEIVDSF